MRIPVFVSGAAVAACFAISAHGADDLMAQLLRLQKTMREHSIINDWTLDGETGQVLSTTLKIDSKTKKTTLVYDRTYSTHEGDESRFTQQNIEYVLTLSTLDPESVTVTKMEGTLSERPLWLVGVATIDRKRTIPYSNLFEIQFSDGTRDASTSKSTVAEVTMGYFEDKAKAEEVADRVRNAIHASSGN